MSSYYCTYIYSCYSFLAPLLLLWVMFTEATGQHMLIPADWQIMFFILLIWFVEIISTFLLNKYYIALQDSHQYTPLYLLMLSCVNQIRETTSKKKAQSSWRWACLQWPVDGEGRTAPRTVDLHSAVKQAQSATATTQPVPLSPGCDLVQGESSSDEHKIGD